ncbi:uncharacterized protein LOC100207073 isoform X1 [Hydra vulgaris]|uniref:uncharacterized protein LOC100207073 isoform X1 n=1 Tax=Hydra vulgaris TaxID=6087 RepID=UPI000641440E|nr:uncharacterized protein LOC100207073 isoform X1 [Hydra vulgaris]
MNAVCFIVAFLIAVSVNKVYTTTWLNTEQERQFKLNTVFSGKNVDWTKIGGIKCFACMDEFPNCKTLRHLCGKTLIREKCKDTCGECRLQSPVDCMLTDYGCCWDNVTVSTGKNNEGCPACVDQYSECQYFKENCKRNDIRVICPNTCGVKCNTCHDDPNQALVCPLYKTYGFCKNSNEVMKQVCSKTCGFC